jgi:hypothetical protein
VPRAHKNLQYINESSLHAGYRKQEPVAVNRRLHFSTLRDGFFCGLFRSRKQSQTGFKVMITSSTHSKPTMALLTTHQMIWRAFVAVVLLLIGVSVALADDRERAQAIHDRLAGVPPTDAVLDTMEGMVAANNFSGAADVAMANQQQYNGDKCAPDHLVRGEECHRRLAVRAACNHHLESRLALLARAK